MIIRFSSVLILTLPIVVGGAQWPPSDPRALTTAQQASVGNLYLFISCTLDCEIMRMFY